MPSSEQTRKTPTNNSSLITWISFIIFLLLTAYYYGFDHIADTGKLTTLDWLIGTWQMESMGYEHGWLVPLIALYLLWHACQRLKGVHPAPSLHGLWSLAPGMLLLLLATRTSQSRVAMAALPFLLTGGVWYFWGRRVALCCAFPFFFLWLCVPVPGFQQATVWMQIIATKLAHWGAGLFGIETLVEGTNITSADGSWDAFSIAGGCSGMRSLVALIMISAAWAYLASGLALWKRVTLALSAFPLAILANAFRVTSIFVFAEYVNPAFASKTWHDWSGLLFFFPASLVGLTLLHGLLSGEIPFLKKRRVVTRRNNEPTTENGKEEA